MRTGLLVPAVAGVVLLATSASVASAADPTFEIGTSLAAATIGVGQDNTSVFGVPSGGFGLLNPGVYVSIFAGKRVAIEPQFGLIWVTSGGHSDHIVSFAGQFDVFFKEADRDSPYVFGSGGLIDTSGSGTTPKFASAGLGYRIRAGDRLTFRFDGRYAHYTEGGGNTVMLGVSIGGLFGKH